MIIDTYPAFLAYWERVQGRPPVDQIDAWAHDYMAAYPELLDKQSACYAKDGEDWRAVAAQRIFSYLTERLSAMADAHANLMAVMPRIELAARERLGADLGIVFVIYVGIGCGAGWAAEYGGKPAVLLGLEAIAELGWQAPELLEGLLAHEIGHLAHQRWRAAVGLSAGAGPWWQLYEEGFAQRMEGVILGRESWHMLGGSYGRDWASWCAAHQAWLASEYLRYVAEGLDVRPFFGSWFEIRGRRQTGYYLGKQLIAALEKTLTLSEIARLHADDPRIPVAVLALREDRIL